MPISASTLTALQKAGTAIFHADEKLKSEVAAYAQRANAAVLNNPYSLGNAALIESWQVTARLSKRLSGIEEELRELYRIAGELTEEDLPIVRETRALSAPASAPTSTGTKKAAKKTVTKAVDLSATTVKVKKATRKQTAKATKAPTAAPTAKAATPLAKGKKTAAKTPTGKPTSKAPVTQPATKAIAKGAKVKGGTTAVATQELQGNPAKLLAYLLKILNTDKFEHIIQTAISKETNIPVGSMTAALARLIKEGRLVAGPQGSYKLVKVAAKATKKSPAPAKTPAAAPEKTPVQATTPAPAATTAPAAAPAPTPVQPEVQTVATPEAQA
ncbi:hypothetical protein [Rhodoferax sp. U11-2br]|uniref:hypothetical protein n=1 Tax=Rhodoferax sp. U11-2br TaxID=2838878 RepID=UPI001BE81082|nr:hypothetical protein [Rhodoferax sp. U11-2br]MBT3066720.1 hypothetical protein [Rhodoferax sp. U11-2br]